MPHQTSVEQVLSPTWPELHLVHNTCIFSVVCVFIWSTEEYTLTFTVTCKVSTYMLQEKAELWLMTQTTALHLKVPQIRRHADYQGHLNENNALFILNKYIYAFLVITGQYMSAGFISPDYSSSVFIHFISPALWHSNTSNRITMAVPNHNNHYCLWIIWICWDGRTSFVRINTPHIQMTTSYLHWINLIHVNLFRNILTYY